MVYILAFQNGCAHYIHGLSVTVSVNGVTVIMASRFVEITKNFRKTFTLPSKDLLNWFPGHMNAGMASMLKNLKSTDCVIEIHDARIPISGRNPRFKEIVEFKPHILILNKMDLIKQSDREKILEKLKGSDTQDIFFLNSTKSKNAVIKDKLFPSIYRVVHSGPRYNRENIDEYNVMIMGVPNVGKSTFVNNLRQTHTTFNRKGAPVGAVAGITRSVSRLRVGFNPDIYIYDTPGILTPSVSDIESGMRLALCSCFSDHNLGEDYIVDYMLFWLNTNEEFNYVKYFELSEPIEDATVLLAHVAKQNKMYKKIVSIQTGKYVYQPNFQKAAQLVLKAFRTGQIGKFMLDGDKLLKSDE